MHATARYVSLAAVLAVGPIAANAAARQIEVVGRLRLTASPGGSSSDAFERFFDADGDGRKDFAWGGDDGGQSYIGLRVDRGQGAFETAYANGWLSYEIPSAIASGDLDGDGVREIVYTTQYQGAVVLARAPNGRYLDSFSFPISSAYTSLQTGDLNGDGDVDVVGLQPDGMYVHWNSNGAFPNAPLVVNLASFARQLALADVDGDGDLDAIAIASSGGGTLAVRRNLGFGTFAPSAIQSVGVQPLAFVLADFDLDGLLDVATANDGAGSVSVLRNLGGGTFAPPVSSPVGFAPHSIDAGDVDGDGEADLVVAGYGDFDAGGVAVLVHQGAGAFASPVSYATGNVRNAALTDLDDDGDLDLAIVDRDALRNRGDGTFASDPLDPTPTNGGIPLAGDVDGDGDEDLILQSDSLIQLRTNLGNGLLSAPVTVTNGGAAWHDLQLVDVDDDGDLDLMSAWYSGPGVRVLLNQGGGFGPAIAIAGGASAQHAEVADVDGDGATDVVARIGSTFAVALRTGAGTWAAFTTLSGAIPAYAWKLGDVDGDGDPDLVTSAPNAVRVHANLGGLAFAAPIVVLPEQGVSLLVRDLDSDGDVDIAASGTEMTSVLWNLGGGVFAAPVEIGPRTGSLAADDLDHDGDLDLLGVVAGSHADVYESDAGYAPVRRFGIAGSPGIATIDLDRDGDEDVLGSSDNRTFVLENGAVTGSAFCAGDGSGTACPCGNASAAGAGRGCLNSLGRAGALTATGSSSIGTDTLRLRGAGMTNSSALYFQGTTMVLGGAGAVFGDGLRCVTGSVVRLGVRTNVAGASTFPSAVQPPLRVIGQVTAPGSRLYQVWYRDAGTFCTSATWNLTSGLQVLWTL